MKKRIAYEDLARILLGAFLAFAGTGHLTFARQDFQAQVPDWVPLDKDLTVVLSGGVEISLGLALIVWARQKKLTGIVAALFFMAVFPGNISQYINRRDAFGLDTDKRRFARLFFQPVLVAWALYGSTVLRRTARREERTFVIDGTKIHDIPSFYQEINRIFMANEDWKLGQSLDALNDMLYGGFGEIKGGGKIRLIWMASEKNRMDLGMEVTREFYRNKLKSPVFDAEFVNDKLTELDNGTGKTYFEIVLEIIADHPNIELVLE